MTTEATIGYIAGLLEGEGSFGFVSEASSTIYLKMTDYDVVLKAASIMGVNPNKIRLAQKVLDHKQGYEFRLFGRDAIKWMRIIRPFMGERRGAKINEIVNTILSKKPFYELGDDFCPKAGHSIKHSWEYNIQLDGSRQCRRCHGNKIRPPFNPQYKLNHIFINPFVGKLSLE